MFFMIFFWITLIAGLILLFRKRPWSFLTNQGPGGISEDFPLDILKKGYAWGWRLIKKNLNRRKGIWGIEE
jgi:hypothetical protein